MQGGLEMGENLFAFNLLTDWNFLKISSQFHILIIVLYDSTKIHGYLLSAQSRAGNLIKPLPPPYKNNFNLIAEHCLKSHTNLS
jgi:hypothetical protein